MIKSAVLVLCTVLTGCSLTPEYHRPELLLNTSWPQTPHIGALREVRATEWRAFFPDPRLQALIAASLENNRDMRIAIARVGEARALFGIVRADRLPNADLVASGTSSRTPADLSLSGRPNIARRDDAGLSLLSFELDFWGRVRSLNDAALASYLASESARQALRLALIADVANAYLGLLEAQVRSELAQETLKNREHARLLVSRRRDAGLASDLDFLQADGVLEQYRAELVGLERQKAAAQNALTLLVGGEPPNLPLGRTLSDQGINPDLAVNLPSTVLLNRPDVLAAEQRLIAANANIGAARAAFLPRISLTAGFGTASNALTGLFDSGQNTWTFQPLLRLPVFDAGRGSAGVDLAEARKQIAVAEYEKVIQQAFREVADLLVEKELLETQFRSQDQVSKIQAERLRLAGARYRAGVSGQLEVLDAQRDSFVAQQSTVQTRRAILSNSAQLYKALGGGLEETP